MDRQTLEQIIGEYGAFKNINEGLKEDAWDYQKRMVLGQIKQGDENFYSGRKPDQVMIAADEELKKYQDNLVNNVTYSDLLRNFSNKELKALLLGNLIPLNDDGSELYKLHKKFYEETQGYDEDKKLIAKDPYEFRRRTIDRARQRSRADAYLAGGEIEDSALVRTADVLEARRKLYAAIDKVKPAPTEEDH